MGATKNAGKEDRTGQASLSDRAPGDGMNGRLHSSGRGRNPNHRQLDAERLRKIASVWDLAQVSGGDEDRYYVIVFTGDRDSANRIASSILAFMNHQRLLTCVLNIAHKLVGLLQRIITVGRQEKRAERARRFSSGCTDERPAAQMQSQRQRRHIEHKRIGHKSTNMRAHSPFVQQSLTY